MNIAGAERKLRQALFFLGWLEQAPRDMVREGANPEQLEFYFSACLSAAKSVYYVLDGSDRALFRDVQKRWRGQLPEPQRSMFGRMMGLRDDDVHVASTGAESLPKYVKEESGLGSQYTYFHRSPLFPSPDFEVENPDGTKISGHIFRGTIGLYLQHQGRRIEAAEACRQFIGQLSSLVDAAKTATQQGQAGGTVRP
jgi:hypothetical protein